MGTIQIDGSTPKITIGNATAEDATILFDGNAQDFYIALDDSADDLLIGLGSTVGTTPAISIDENLAVKTYGDITMTGTTPVLTIGDAGAEDTAIVFDGNAQDFYIALDDSADDLVIGLGSTVGTTPAISINEDRDVTISDGAIDFDIASHDTSNGLKLGGTLVTATAAELNIMDGVTSTAAELNIMDGVTSTAAELNIMDGVTSTAAEINLIDGGTSRGTTAIADGDGVLINDGGTMRQTTVETLATYIGGGITQADTWGIGSATAITDDFLTTNWFNATEGGVPLGSALTQSSGVFSFPSTGWYLINYQFTCQSSSSNYFFTEVYCSMHWTEDNSSYGLLAATFPVIPQSASSNIYNSASNNIIIDVVNTTNVKFKFKIRAYAGAGTQALTVHGLTTGLHSGFTCVRLADT